MPTNKDRRKKYHRWLLQVIDGIDGPFSSRIILENWDKYAPSRYKPQINLLANLIRQLSAKKLIRRIGEERVRTISHSTYPVPMFIRVYEEE